MALLTKRVFSFIVAVMDSDLFMPAGFDHIKKERERARELKKTLWWRKKVQSGLCYHCGKFFPEKSLTMDHLTPLARGGRTGKNNVVVSCKNCNSKKSFKSLIELRLKKR